MPSGTDEISAEARKRVKQVFLFLRELAKRNVPQKLRLADQPWVLRLADLPMHPAITLGEVHPVKAGETPESKDDTADDPPLLRVRRPKITKAPIPPELILEWLNPTWSDPNGSIEVVPARNVRRGADTITVAFSDDIVRTQALLDWKTRWELWAEAERPTRAAMRVFERLYELRGQIELESERVELFLGDGRLSWKTSIGDIDHPILLQRVELEFDPDIPEIRLVDADRAPELYSVLMPDGEQISPEVFSTLRNELERTCYHPLSKVGTSAFLRRLVQMLSAGGSFHDDNKLVAPGANPALSRDPALFLRGRVTGFSAAFERILEDLEQGRELPVSLTRLMGLTPPIQEREISAATSPWGEPLDVLLSKPANPEQIEIARALDRHHAILVQGPPGTGKSHTIANLIGHLVAHGKRVLVTSHTTKALRVLRGQIVETLQPLCVAVLESDLEARTQMEQSVRGILARLTTAREDGLEREVADLAQARVALNSDIDGLTQELKVVREAEYVPIVLAGEPVAPSDAARWVKGNSEAHSWIPGPVESGSPFPLDPKELAALYFTNGRLTQKEENEIEEGLPSIEEIPSSDAFSDLLGAASGGSDQGGLRLWERQPQEGDLPDLERLALLVRSATESLGTLEPWQRQIVAAGHSGGTERGVWISLRDRVREARLRVEAARPLFIEHLPAISIRNAPPDLRISLEGLREYVSGGGSLGTVSLMFRFRWKAALSVCRVNGGAPNAAAHFRSLLAHLEVEEGRERLRVVWSRQAETIGLPAISKCGTPPEPQLYELAEQFEGLLDWWSSHWEPIQGALRAAGFRWEVFRNQATAKSDPAPPFERDAVLLESQLPDRVEAHLARVRADQAENRLRALAGLIELHRGPICRRLQQAVTARDVAEYRVSREALLDLSAKREAWQTRGRLVDKLASTAPGWAKAIRHRAGVHSGVAVPGDAVLAWRWRQLRQEIDRRAKLDEIRLSTRLLQRKAELRNATTELIDRRAWLGQLRRTDLTARLALQGWADTQRRIGKGTGKRVPELQARARELLAKARDAVPVWIMPLNRVAESFDPRQGRFDVVIVDEASQADVNGLLCWYLGKHIAVVGDHEQVSPLAVGQQIEPVVNLIRHHLGGIPNSHLYDGLTSLYHLARTCFGGAIPLREHFRCVPDIIEFSNRLSYDGEIRPLRNPASAPQPHVVEYVINSSEASGRDGRHNLTEARTVAALVKAVTELREYDGKTVGAISLLGDEQSGLIQDITVGLVGAVALEHRRFSSGTAGQFQGDERDVIFLSMVDAPTGGILAIRQTDVFKQRYNVAASRAKNQLWLIHSLDPSRDLRAGDLRRTLIEHVRDPSGKRRAVELTQSRAESLFESEVIARLVGAGYRVKSQVWIGKYRIDMVVSDGIHQVALECDGDRFHGIDQIPADMNRQAILERAGWAFIRVRGTRFFRDPEGTTQWILDELTRLGVEPLGEDARSAPLNDVAAASRERVIRRATEIMQECGWVRSPESGEASQEDSSIPLS
jgi:very-short-patch-repair endonuclease